MTSSWQPDRYDPRHHQQYMQQQQLEAQQAWHGPGGNLVRCLECGAETAEAGQVCGRCGAPTDMLAADPVPPVDDRPDPASRAIWRWPRIIAVAAVVAVACLATAITIISGRPAAPSRLRASATPAAPATPSASVRWTYPTAGSVDPGPAVGGTVYVSSNTYLGNGTVYALDTATGRPRWAYATGDAVDSSPAVAGGTVYVGRDDGTVYALDAGS